MREYSTSAIRNVALISHSGAGKTILVEALLYHLGVTTRMGSISEGNTVSDFEEEEIRRGVSLSTSVIPLEYKDHKINLLDTPGSPDFIGEVISALWVAEAATVLVDAVAGPAVGTEVTWSYARKFHLPRMVIINKMDREGAQFQRRLEEMADISEIRLIPVQLPIGSGPGGGGPVHHEGLPGPGEPGGGHSPGDDGPGGRGPHGSGGSRGGER